MKIGFFDSGIGGLTVLKTAMDRLRHEQFVFYADTKHVPYGGKPAEEITEYAIEAMDFLMEQDVKAVVVACNTATSAAIETLREKYPIPIVGMEPAAKLALKKDPEKRILVIATEFTVHGEKLQKLLGRVDTEHRVDLLPMPELVILAENLNFGDDAREYIKATLSKVDVNRYSAVVFGCTHFTYFKDIFKELMPEGTDLVDGNAGTVKQLVSLLSKREALENNDQTVVFYESGEKAEGDRMIRILRLLERIKEIQNI